MLGLCGYDKLIRDVFSVSTEILGKREVASIAELRLFYAEALAVLMPMMKPSGDVFVRDIVLENELASRFRESALDDLKQSLLIGEPYPEVERERKIEFVWRAISELKRRNMEFGDVFDLLVHRIFIRGSVRSTELSKTPRAGTTTRAPGVIWLVVPENDSVLDLVETLIHELTHLSVFLDELVNPQFFYREITKRENYCHSAILGRRRPLDKVVHSIVVGTEILLARDCFLCENEGGTSSHPSSEAIAHGIATACSEVLQLANLRDLVTDWTHRLVTDCSKTSKNFLPRMRVLP